MQLDALPGLLVGRYRGIEFHVPDTSTEAGRRVVETLFPGIDAAAYDDYGRAPNAISLDGFIIGDDYQAKGKALAAAFNTAGPATLIHPWLGPMSVIVEDTAQISYSDRELRMVRFSVTFKRVSGGAGLGGASLGISSLVSSISGVISAASGLSSAVGVQTMSAVRSSATLRTARLLSVFANAVPAPQNSARAMPRLKAALSGTAYAPDALDAAVVNASGILAEAALIPAVAFYNGQLPDVPASTALMSIAASMAERLAGDLSAAPADADMALLASSAAHFLAQAASQSLYADYPSRNDAIALRSRLYGAIDAVCDALEPSGGSAAYYAERSALGRSLRDLQAQLMADISQTIGRLPAVVVFNPERDTDAFLLAAHLYGDTPARIEEAYADIVRRNRPRHPAILPAGQIEVLEP